MTRNSLGGAAVIALLAASLSACNGSNAAESAADTAKVAEAVKADVAQLIKDVNAHDQTRMASHSVDGAVLMFHGQPNAIAHKSPPPPPDPSLKVSLANESVDVAASGDMAVYHSTYTANFTDPQTKKPGVDVGNYLAGYKSQPDGSWKQTWSVVANSAPAPN